jgi:hypothetical protein
MQPRLALAAVVATVADAVYGFAVYGNALNGQFSAFPAVFRSAEAGPAYLPGMFVGILVAMFAVAYMYAKGYEGGNGLQEGLRFGSLLAIVNAGYFVGVNYAILNIGPGVAVGMALAGLGEWLLIGSVIGAIYKPAGLPRRAGASGV